MNPSILKAIAKGLFVPIALWMFMGCTHLSRPSDSTSGTIDNAEQSEIPSIKFHVHRVRWSGETLSVITQWYTGSYKNWPTVAEANPNLDPKRISSGDDILIPIDLLETTEPMPREFLKTSSRKKKSPPSRHVDKTVEPTKIELPEPRSTEHLETGSNKAALLGPQDTKKTMPESAKIEFPEPQSAEQPLLETDDIELFGPQDTTESMVENDDIELFGPHDREQPMVETTEVELFGPKDSDPKLSESDELELFER